MRPRTSISILIAAAGTALVAAAPVRAADEPSLDTVIKRVAAYVASYGPQLANIVAEERYSQWIETEPGTVVVPGLGRTRREIRSDFVLTLLGDDTWVAFRDAFEVDGSPVRDREDRLVELLSRGGDQAWRQASAIANESARFNIGTRLVARNINVPTFVIQLMQDRNRDRFRFSRAKFSDGRDRKSGGVNAQLQGVEESRRWAIEYRERSRPTLVRQVSGGDQPLRGTMLVDSQTGEVLETTLTWERGPGGIILVTFARVPDVDLLVPVRMSEQYRDARTTIFGEAVYSRFRRFTTSARVITSESPSSTEPR